jgi:hypothetical protein
MISRFCVNIILHNINYTYANNYNKTPESDKITGETYYYNILCSKRYFSHYFNISSVICIIYQYNSYLGVLMVGGMEKVTANSGRRSVIFVHSSNNMSDISLCTSNNNMLNTYIIFHISSWLINYTRPNSICTHMVLRLNVI